MQAYHTQTTTIIGNKLNFLFDYSEIAKDVPDDVLADYIYERAETQSLAENGGHNAYCCPYGCGCHTVSLDLELTNAENEE